MKWFFMALRLQPSSLASRRRRGHAVLQKSTSARDFAAKAYLFNHPFSENMHDLRGVGFAYFNHALMAAVAAAYGHWNFHCSTLIVGMYG